MALIKKRSKKAGLPPGSLVYIGDNAEHAHAKVNISLIKYNSEQLTEKNNITVEECKNLISNDSVNWINVCGIHHADILRSLGTQFGLHALVLEDIMNTSQRSKFDDYKDYLFIVLRMLHYDNEKDTVKDEQVSLVLGNNFLISFLEKSSEQFEVVKERLRNNHTKIRSLGADYLCYTLIDTIVDHYFSILEIIDKKLEGLELSLLKSSSPELMKQIHRLKREVILLKKDIWPMREVLSHLRHLETSLIKPETELYLHDVYDHTIQAIETIESFRDLTSGMLDIYLSNISQRMNEIMKVLTVVATIFVPLTFIASLYGMNFDYMPELHSRWGYPLTLCIMFLTAMCMVLYFRKKRWI